MKTRTTALTFAAIGLMMLAGCATTSDTDDDASGSSDTGSEFNQGETPASDMVTDSTGGSMQLGTAYFDYDRAEIRGDMRDVLKANAEVLQRSNGTAVIEGHADERGSEEYNLALGERRAEALVPWGWSPVTRAIAAGIGYSEAGPKEKLFSKAMGVRFLQGWARANAESEASSWAIGSIASCEDEVATAVDALISNGHVALIKAPFSSSGQDRIRVITELSTPQ